MTFLSKLLMKTNTMQNDLDAKFQENDFKNDSLSFWEIITVRTMNFISYVILAMEENHKFLYMVLIALFVVFLVCDAMIPRTERVIKTAVDSTSSKVRTPKKVIFF